MKHASKASSSPHSKWARIRHGVARRIRSSLARLANRNANFGRGCDIRHGLSCLIGGTGSVSFGAECIIDRFMTIEATGNLWVGEHVTFGHHVTLGAIENVSIGDDTMIGELVSIRDHDHAFDRIDIPIRDQGARSSPVRIGRDVWIGGKATVLKGVTIGNQAIIGANSVVTRDIPDLAIAVGSPARVIGYRGEFKDDSIIEQVAH